LKFSFVSTNSDGDNRIFKIIVYDRITKHNVGYYNLGFGDLDLSTGELDDEAESNNGDMRKILATVVSTLAFIFEIHPNEKVHLDGSTHLRLQYYHKLVRDYYKKITERYVVEGCLDGRIESFSPEKEYDFILISLK
jgi:hypothetical protein